jgi:hypothetical protein
MVHELARDCRLSVLPERPLPVTCVGKRGPSVKSNPGTRVKREFQSETRRTQCPPPGSLLTLPIGFGALD